MASLALSPKGACVMKPSFCPLYLYMWINNFDHRNYEWQPFSTCVFVELIQKLKKHDMEMKAKEKEENEEEDDSDSDWRELPKVKTPSFTRGH